MMNKMNLINCANCGFLQVDCTCASGCTELVSIPWKLSVCIVVMGEDWDEHCGEVYPVYLMGYNLKRKAWCLPGGKVESIDSTIEVAAKRELFEETGFAEGKLLHLFNVEHLDVDHNIRWFCVVFLCKIDGAPQPAVTLPEMDRWKWVTVLPTDSWDLARGVFNRLQALNWRRFNELHADFYS